MARGNGLSALTAAGSEGKNKRWRNNWAMVMGELSAKKSPAAKREGDGPKRSIVRGPGTVE